MQVEGHCKYCRRKVKVEIIKEYSVVDQHRENTTYVFQDVKIADHTVGRFSKEKCLRSGETARRRIDKIVKKIAKELECKECGEIVESEYDKTEQVNMNDPTRGRFGESCNSQIFNTKYHVNKKGIKCSKSNRRMFFRKSEYFVDDERYTTMKCPKCKKIITGMRIKYSYGEDLDSHGEGAYSTVPWTENTYLILKHNSDKDMVCNAVFTRVTESEENNGSGERDIKRQINLNGSV